MLTNSIISSVFLPGVGQVCPECLTRGHVPELRLSLREVYSFGITEPQSQLDWDVDAARAFISARPRAPQRLDPVWLERWLTDRTTVTAEHLDHIPDHRLDEPGIVVEVMACAPGGEPEPFRILIDGSHRAARKLRDRQDCWAYLLTEEEQRSICTYYVDSRIVEMPTFPGRGIGDAEAGVFLESISVADNVA